MIFPVPPREGTRPVTNQATAASFSGYNGPMNLTGLLPLLLGLVAGLLVNYLADVLPRTRSLSTPCCTACQAQLPVMDYLLFRRCPSCRARRPLRALLVPPALMLAYGWQWFFPQEGIPFPLTVLLLAYLLLVFLIDLEHRLILHPVSIAGALIGLGSGLALRGETSLGHGLSTTLIGGGAGFLIMLAFYLLGEWYVRRLARKKKLPSDEVALGFGDVSLSGILGLVLGWPAILVGLFFAVLAGGAVSLVILLVMVLRRKYRAFTAIPYAPFLILGAVVLLYCL